MAENWHAQVKELVRMTPEYICGKRAFNISQNEGRDAGQRVSHCHTWLIFREGEIDKKSYQLGFKALIDTINT
jgi:diadenosine tetraphosphate (Ap4A) HIT family hydrolase